MRNAGIRDMRKIAKKYRSSTDFRFFPQDRSRIGSVCTILGIRKQWVQGKIQEVALVEFADGYRSAWLASALETGNNASYYHNGY